MASISWDMRNWPLSLPKARPKPLQAPLCSLWAITQRQADSSSAFTSSSSVHSPRRPRHLFIPEPCPLSTQSRIPSRSISYITMSSNTTSNAQDPVERTTSPYPDPRQLGPKSKILATRTSNYHSTSLRNMVTANTVNKTALHPGGVQYVCVFCHTKADLLILVCRPVKEHTELEEELHEKAHIDYDRVAIVSQWHFRPHLSHLY
jgi:hypothetical protein